MFGLLGGHARSINSTQATGPLGPTIVGEGLRAVGMAVAEPRPDTVGAE